MNSLSWLIYLANVIENLGSGLGGTAAFFITSGGFISTGSFIFYMVEKNSDWDSNEKLLASLKKTFKYSICTLVVGLFIGLISQLVPNQKTIYAIAASEMGEVVVKTPEAQEVLQALKGKIMEQLEPTTKE